MDRPVAETRVAFTLNGRRVSADPVAGERLSHTLRERLGARDVKVGCDAGDCGACTVLIDGRPVCACLTPSQQAAATTVQTLQALVATPEGRSLADAFETHGAAQCGICTPGMMVSALALLKERPEPTEAEVMDALGGVLCRCTGYRKIIAAVMGTNAHDEGGAGHVGSRRRRLDGADKVAGRENFGDDIAPPDALVIRVIRSPHDRAAFRFGDLDAWQAGQPGITAVLTAGDIRGENRFGVIPGFIDQKVFAEGEALFRGEAVAAVVGTADAMSGFDAFPVTWQPRLAAIGVGGARKTDAPQVQPHREGNVMCTGRVARGNAEMALESADVTVAGDFRTRFVEHAYIEPEAGFAEIVEGRVHIYACTQAPVMDRESLAQVLGVDETDIRIVPTGCGGGFGSKLDLSVQPYLALAALKTGRPVRLAYSRTESMQSTTKRHPGEMSVRIGASRDGTLTAMAFDGDFDTGAYSSWGPTVATRVPIHASGPYRIANYRAEARGIHTHTVPSGAFRGFGVPQAALALEGLLDELADQLGIDRLEFRIRNALRNGDATVCGQIFTQGVGISACLKALRPAWETERAVAPPAGTIRGVGVAAGWYGCGNTSLANPSTIKAGIRSDGTVVLHQGATDMGQGANTVIAQIFATALGVPLESLSLIGPDTDATPDAGKSSASRQTFISGKAAQRTGEALRARILSLVNVGEAAELLPENGKITVRDAGGTHEINLVQLSPDTDDYVLCAEESYDPPTKPLDENGQGEPYAQFGYAAHLAVVEVDEALGIVRPTRFVAAHDLGRAVNPMLVEGQVEGGIAQGLGMALMEEYLPGSTENLHDYLIPTIGDVPPIETLIIEEPDAHGPYGAKGLGEHALIPTAPAILNAIRDATGVRMTEVPVTPARLRARLRVADDV